MNRVEELIQQLCPNGVEWKKLGEVTRIERGKRLTKSELLDKGDFPVFHGGIEPLGYYNSYNRECDTVMIINVGASAGTIGYSEKNFWSSDGCFCIKRIEQIKSKFLYYFLIGQESFLASKVRKAGIPTLDSLVVENILVPIPPLPIQQEIVRILDTFTELTANLQTELDARKKQYAYYRDCLLNFEGVDGVEWKKLGEIANFRRGSFPQPYGKKEWYDGIGAMPFVQVADISDNKQLVKETSRKISIVAQPKSVFAPKGSIIISLQGSIGRIAVTQYDAYIDRTIAIFQDISKNIIPTYFVYQLERIFEEKEKKARGGIIKTITKEEFTEFPIPIPPLPEQRRIVAILDHFETLVNDLSVGLPAELEARRKQYEYYRDKLLTFDRV